MVRDDKHSTSRVHVLLADSRPMENQLLAGALQHQGLDVYSCDADSEAILEFIERDHADVLVMSCTSSSSGTDDITMLRTVHLSIPSLPKVVLLDRDVPEIVVQAFRSGARGLFCLADSSFQRFCECIERVSEGGVWASTRQLGFLLDSVCQLPGTRVIGAVGQRLLTSREEQVVALVSDGLSNRNIATELGLSEHTVKKYLFRIFEKLGISNRVELVLYAVHNGATPQPEWVASA